MQLTKTTDGHDIAQILSAAKTLEIHACPARFACFRKGVFEITLGNRHSHLEPCLAEGGKIQENHPPDNKGSSPSTPVIMSNIV